MFDSKIEKCGYDAVLDLHMSREFGLDWKEYEYTRMKYIQYAMNCEAKKQEKELKKQKNQGRYGRK